MPSALFGPKVLKFGSKVALIKPPKNFVVSPAHCPEHIKLPFPKPVEWDGTMGKDDQSFTPFPPSPWNSKSENSCQIYFFDLYSQICQILTNQNVYLYLINTVLAMHFGGMKLCLEKC